MRITSLKKLLIYWIRLMVFCHALILPESIHSFIILLLFSCRTTSSNYEVSFLYFSLAWSMSIKITDRVKNNDITSLLCLFTWRILPKKLGIAPSALFSIKLSRVLSGNGPFAWEFGYSWYLTPSAPFLLTVKRKGLSCCPRTAYIFSFNFNEHINSHYL